jgi:hypothetical protein
MPVAGGGKRNIKQIAVRTAGTGAWIRNLLVESSRIQVSDLTLVYNLQFRNLAVQDSFPTAPNTAAKPHPTRPSPTQPNPRRPILPHPQPHAALKLNLPVGRWATVPTNELRTLRTEVPLFGNHMSLPVLSQPSSAKKCSSSLSAVRCSCYPR